MDVQSVLPAVVAVGLTVLWLCMSNIAALGDWLVRSWRAAWQKLGTKAAFFWFVNITFMAVSVLHAGLFFALLEPENAFFGLASLLGFAVALVLDLASIVFMQARLKSLRMNERGSAGWYLFSIMVCSGLSAFGNLAMSLQDFKPDTLKNAGWAIQDVAPWLGVAFPLLIILISIAADKVLDVDPTENLDVNAYHEQEEKRISIMIERNNFLEKQTEQDRRRVRIKQQGKQRKQEKIENQQRAELEQLVAHIQLLQEQIQELQSLSFAAAAGGQSEQRVLPHVGVKLAENEETNHDDLVARTGSISYQKSLSFQPTMYHHLALNYLQSHPDLLPQFREILRSNPSSGFEHIASLVCEQSGLKFRFLNAQFIAEVWFLLHVSKEFHAENDESFERSTDPEHEAIVAAKSADMMVVQAGNMGAESGQDVGGNEEERDPHVSGRSGSFAAGDRPRITRKLAPLAPQNEGQSEGETKGNRRPYIITKEAAAKQLRCSIKAIDEAIKAGQIKVYAKDESKVLVSSVEGFHSKRRRLAKSA